jgi:hypothetical protein
MHPALRSIAESRLGVFTSAEARRAGYRPDEMRSALRSGSWRWLRRGVYMATADWSSIAGDARLRHIVDCIAVAVSLAPGPVVSHASAARVHRLLVPSTDDGVVRLTDVDQWREGRGYRVARAALPPSDVVSSAGFSLTAPARTLVDCAREWSLADAVISMDAALHDRLVTRLGLQTAVLAATHWVGIGTAARALGLADGRAESPLESRGRLALVGAGLPQPELQVDLYGPQGWVARVDAWYDEAAVAVEFDGRVKYMDPRDGRSPGEVLWREKRREDAMRELGVRVVRIVDADVSRGLRPLAARVAGLLTTPFAGPRRFTVGRRDEPGTGTSDVA